MFPNKITFVRVGRSRISYTKQIADQAEFFAVTFFLYRVVIEFKKRMIDGFPVRIARGPKLDP